MPPDSLRHRLMFLAFCGLSVSSPTAPAHPPGLSGAEVSIARDRIAVVLSFAVQDLETLAPADTDRDAEVSASERAEWTARLVTLAKRVVAVTAEGKRYGATGASRVRFDADDTCISTSPSSAPPQRASASTQTSRSASPLGTASSSR